MLSQHKPRGLRGHTMNTTDKGNQLEDKLYSYLLDQLDRDERVFDVYPSELCQVYKKKKYYCKERGGDVEFDVVIEVRRKDRPEPHLFVLFECKNHSDPIQERDITDFSDKVGRIFGHAAKGLIVSSSRLRSGAESIARSRRIGIVKFDENGIEIVADRRGRSFPESQFLKIQIFEGSPKTRSVKFSAYSDGRLFASVRELLRSFGPSRIGERNSSSEQRSETVIFVPEAEIRKVAQEALNLAQYDEGSVDLKKLCAKLDLELTFSKRRIHDLDGNPVLGSANFSNRSIEVNLHGNPHRERFTIAHELGHFCLRHDHYLHSESLVEQDLFADAQTDRNFNLERLEYQANIFASELTLPDEHFRLVLTALRRQLGIYDKGFGYIFVDDQPCNYNPYNQITSSLSDYFEISRHAIEIRLKRMGLVTDKRRNNQLGSLLFAGRLPEC